MLGEKCYMLDEKGVMKRDTITYNAAISACGKGRADARGSL